MTEKNPEITIVGAGVVGLCAARAVLDKGGKVTLVERNEGLGENACSWWAGGMLAPYCEGETADEVVVRLGKQSIDWWDKHTGLVERKGTLVVSAERDHSDLERFARQTEGHSHVGDNAIADLEESLQGRFSKGLFFKDEAHLSPRDALTALKQSLINDGVRFIQDEVDPKSIAKDGLVIDCRGLAAKQDLPDLRGVMGEMVMLSCPEISLNRPIRLLHPRIPLYIVPRGDGIFMIGATMIESSARYNVTARSLLELLSSAYALNPMFGEAEVIEIGVDSRPAFGDNIPRIRRDGNLIHINGMYRHGYLMAPSMAEMVAGMIFENITPELFNENPN